jgi:hypothetical protein
MPDLSECRHDARDPLLFHRRLRHHLSFGSNAQFGQLPEKRMRSQMAMSASPRTRVAGLYATPPKPDRVSVAE